MRIGYEGHDPWWERQWIFLTQAVLKEHKHELRAQCKRHNVLLRDVIVEADVPLKLGYECPTFKIARLLAQAADRLMPAKDAWRALASISIFFDELAEQHGVDLLEACRDIISLRGLLPQRNDLSALRTIYRNRRSFMRAKWVAVLRDAQCSEEYIARNLEECEIPDLLLEAGLRGTEGSPTAYEAMDFDLSHWWSDVICDLVKRVAVAGKTLTTTA